ncbi:MAG: ImmA/IrrE family metallo-endopeptidase [Sphingobacteriia bacterium]
MSKISFNKENFFRLLLANIEYNSSTSVRAKEYLENEGLDVDNLVKTGMEEINSIIKRFELKSVSQAKHRGEAFQRSWNHISVKRLIKESGNPDPMDEIKTRARNLVISAFERGWEGPPYSPIQLAKLLGIDVIPNDSVLDACIVPNNIGFQIQYNPFQRPTRINFSVSHEIAHTLFSDCADAIRNRENYPSENRQLEQLCNAAAAEIQLPYAIFSNDANSFTPSMDGLIDLAKKYSASLESVFIRYTEVIDKPCAILIGIFQSDNKIVIDYYKSSRSFPISLPENIEIPQDSHVYECTSPGWTSEEELTSWNIFNGYNCKIYSVGISPYRRDNKPRVGILVLPANNKVNNTSEEIGKVVLVYGDATKPRGKGKKIIAQVVNTGAALGRGFGYSLSKNYPIVKEELQKWKKDKDSFKLGASNLVMVNSSLYIFQMLAQKGIFPTGLEIPLRYKELRMCLIELRNKAIELGCSIHMPAIGAGQAGGNWDIIIGMIHDELINYNIKVTIYLLPGKPITKKERSNLTVFKEDSTWESEKLF